MAYKDINIKRQKQREWWSRNTDKISAKKREEYKNNILVNNKRRADAMKYYWENRDRVRKTQNKYEIERKKRDPAFLLRKNLRSRIHEALKDDAKKAYKTIELLGCDMEKCRIWLEDRFLPGMTWENYGEWHVDHILPCAVFDLASPDEQKKCFHYTNLQPLWADDNGKKSYHIEVFTSEGIFWV